MYISFFEDSKHAGGWQYLNVSASEKLAQTCPQNKLCHVHFFAWFFPANLYIMDNRDWRWKSAWRSQRALNNGPAWASAIITLTHSLARSCNHSPIHALPHSFTQFEHKSSFGCETEPASAWGKVAEHTKKLLNRYVLQVAIEVLWFGHFPCRTAVVHQPFCVRYISHFMWEMVRWVLDGNGKLDDAMLTMTQFSLSVYAILFLCSVFLPHSALNQSYFHWK